MTNTSQSVVWYKVLLLNMKTFESYSQFGNDKNNYFFIRLPCSSKPSQSHSLTKAQLKIRSVFNFIRIKQLTIIKHPGVVCGRTPEHYYAISGCSSVVTTAVIPTLTLLTLLTLLRTGRRKGLSLNSHCTMLHISLTWLLWNDYYIWYIILCCT